MKLKPDWVIAFAAIFISTATLFVYIYQARIMQKQQQTSVWPYVEWLYSNAENQFVITVENKGIGPAIIKGLTMKLDGEVIGSNSALFKKLLGTSDFEFINSTVARRVISAGEKVEMVHVYDSAMAHAIDSLLLWNNSAHTFALEICYCSVYDDCWRTDGTKITESSCD